MQLKHLLLSFMTLAGSFTYAHNGWERTRYLSIYSLNSYADTGFIYSPQFYFPNYLHLPFHPSIYSNTKPGDLVFVQAHYLFSFCKEVLPFLPGPVTLIICSDLDLSVPSDVLPQPLVEPLLNHKNIHHIFSTNCDYKGPSSKISPLPIGIDFHSRAYLKTPGESSLEQEALLDATIQSLPPTSQRKKRIFVDFQHNDTMARATGARAQFYAGETRTSIFNFLLSTGLVDYAPLLPRDKLWNIKGQYAFSVSPHGHGLDSHRTWEDLALGCIVIVKTSPLDPLYEDLPVVIVQSWDEVTYENLELWFERYSDALTNPLYRSRLTTAYWLNKIREIP